MKFGIEFRENVGNILMTFRENSKKISWNLEKICQQNWNKISKKLYEFLIKFQENLENSSRNLKQISGKMRKCQQNFDKIFRKMLVNWK